MLVRLPLWDRVYNDEPQPARYSHPLEGKFHTQPQLKEYDVVVIGSGAGGAPVATMMAGKGFKTLVLESGELVRPQTTADTVEKYFYRQGMTVSTKGSFLMSLAGNTIGGTTSINSGTSLRPTKKQLAIWDEILGTDFASGILDSYFSEVEKNIGVTVPPRELLGPSAHLIEKGLAKMGRTGAYVLPRNAPLCEGSGRCCFVCPAGAKLSTDMSYLKNFVAAGGELVGGAKVTSIKEDGARVVVAGKSLEGDFCVTAKKLVIAAGSFGTTELVAKNKLGTAYGEAGKNFGTHPASKVFAFFDHAVHGEKGVPQGLGYADPELPRVVFEGVFTPKSAAAPLIQLTGPSQRAWLDHFDQVASFAFLFVDDSKGRVRFIGNEMVIRYKLSREDIVEIVKASKLIGEIFFNAGAKKVLLPLVGTQNEFYSLAELKKLNPETIKTNQVMTSGFHPRGTASMGKVVDTDLKVFGLNHVYVCDASVMPASPGVNPQITIMGLSLRLAEHLCSTLA